MYETDRFGPDMRSDAIVLGGGIIGTSIARELCRAGMSVRLVDPNGFGGGTSARCDGNLLVQTKHDDLGVRLMLRSLQGYRAWSEQLGIDLHFRQPGSLLVFTGAEGATAATDRVRELGPLGVDAELLTAAQVHERQPGLNSDIVAGIDCHQDASVYPPTVVAALLDDAVAHGCRVARASGVRLLVDDAGRTSGVLTDRGELRAPWVVNAMGVWSGAFDAGGAVALPVRPRQGVLVVTERAPGLVERAITEASYMTNRASGGTGTRAQVSFVAEPTHDGTILIGSSRRFCGFDTQVPHHLFSEIVTRARDFMPGLGRLRIIRSFAGLRPWSPDNRPIVGAADRVPGYLPATGHEGEGIGFAPVTAELIRHAILDRPTDELLSRAADAWSPNRFDASRSLEGAR